MFTWGVCVKKMLILNEVVRPKCQRDISIFTLRIICIKFETFNSKFYKIISNIRHNYKDFDIYKAFSLLLSYTVLR